MNIRHTLAAVALPLILAACDSQAPADPPKPQVTAPTNPSNESGTSSLANAGENPVSGPTGTVYPVPPSSTAGPAPAPSDAGKDSPETEAASTLSESEEENKMPLAGHGNNHSSDSLEAGASK